MAEERAVKGAVMRVCAVALVLCVALLGCGSTQSVSADATAQGEGTPALDALSAAAVDSAESIASLLDQLPDASVEYALPEQGGLFTASPEGSPAAGSYPDEPMIQIDRDWDVGPDGMDITGVNELSVTASAKAQQYSRGPNVELSLVFSPDSVLARYQDLTLPDVIHALRNEHFVLQGVRVDPTVYPGSFTTRSGLRALASTYESGAGFEKETPDRKDYELADDEYVADVARVLPRATAAVVESWATEDPDRPALEVAERTLLLLGVCRQQCVVTGRAEVSHPTWGTISVYTTQLTDPPGEAHIVAIDEAGLVRWRYDADFFYTLAVAEGGVDSTGHVFINFDPGSLNGVIILSPTAGGFENFDTLPPSGEYRTRFYGARAVDIDDDGTMEIETEANECVPSCHGGTSTVEVFRWNGDDYIGV